MRQDRMIRQWCIALGLLLTLVSPAAAQVRGPATFTMDVPAGKWKAARLRNLPEAAVVALRVLTSGDILVAFLDADDYRRFPTVTRPLFTGRVEKQIAMSLKIPAAGHYFVVLDNRLGREPRRVTVTIRAARGKRQENSNEKLTRLRPAHPSGPAGHETCPAGGIPAQVSASSTTHLRYCVSLTASRTG